tara:strand:- start:541 stop:1515 length:975 start_codon:yes stop_codon:yes gene_type:complete
LVEKVIKRENKMKVLSKYMYGGKSTYKNGGINAPKGFHWMKKGDGKYKIMKHGDKPFKPHEGASLKAKFPVQKKHNPKQDAKMAKRKYEEGGYLGYQKPEEYKNITLRPSEIPMFSIPETYSDLDKGKRREKREERFRKRYKKKLDKAYEDAAKERANEMEDLEGMNERQKRRYKRKQAREEKRYSRKRTRRERRADRKDYGRPDDYLYGVAPGRNMQGSYRHGRFYLDPETGEQMFKTRKFRGKDEPPSYTRHANIRYSDRVHEEGDREAHEKGKKALEEDYGIIEERGRHRTDRREARYNRRQRRRQQRQSRREKRRERKYT